MRKPSRPRSTPKQPSRSIDDLDDLTLERVRGGNQVPYEPPIVSGSDDWEAPVV